MEVERANLLSLVRRIVEELIQFIVNKSDPAKILPIILHLSCILEHCFCHGLKGSEQQSRSIKHRSPSIDKKSSSIDNSEQPVISPRSLDFLFNTTASAFRLAKDQVLSATASITSSSSNSGHLSKNGIVKLDSLLPNPWPVVSKLQDMHSKLHPNTSSQVYDRAALRKQGSANSGLGLTRLWIRAKLCDQLDVLPYSIYMVPCSPSSPSIDSSSLAVDNSHSTQYHSDRASFLEGLIADLRSRLSQANSQVTRYRDRIESLQDQIDSLSLERQSLKVTIDVLKHQAKQVVRPADLSTSPKVEVDRVSANELPTSSTTSAIGSAVVASPNSKCSDIANSDFSPIDLESKLSQLRLTLNQRDQQLSTQQCSIKQKQSLIQQLEARSRAMTSIVDQMKERLTSVQSDKLSVERLANQLRGQVDDLKVMMDHQSNELAKRQQTIESLQCQLVDKDGQIGQLKTQLVELEALRREKVDLNKQLTECQLKIQQSDVTLNQMARVVTSSKLEVDQLRDTHQALLHASWQDDAQVSNCSQCRLEFGLSLRKHHCRNCGLIFCANCSSKFLPLPSSPKPMRVCDACHELLLIRYTKIK